MNELYVLVAILMGVLAIRNAWRLFKPSKVSQDVIDSINNNPEDWRPISETSYFGEWCRGIENPKIGIQVKGLGNSRLLSVCGIHAKLDATSEYSELKQIGFMCHVENAGLNWFKTAPLEAIAKA